MKAVADTLAVARSNLVEAARGQRRPRQPYRKARRVPVHLAPARRRAPDLRLSPARRPAQSRASCPRRADGQRQARAPRPAGCRPHSPCRPTPPAGPAGPTTAPSWRPARTSAGVSDHLRVLFAIDACDCEILGWHATTAGISGEMVRDLMVTWVERRFGATRTANTVEWLSDNGSAYTGQGHARHGHRPWPAARLHAGPLARKQRHRRGVREDPQVRLCQGHPAPGCQTILGLVSAWIEDYNTSRPHSGLRMLSLREFRARCA